MMELIGKKILFIAPAFFGYEKKIVNKMISIGADVDFFDERSIKSAYGRALLKINPRIFQRKTMEYYCQIIEGISDNRYDYVFVIKCEMMPVEIIKRLKELFSDAKFCLYLYDSIDNIKGIKTKLKHFDRVMSFDIEDVRNETNMIFRPLFFIDDFNDNNTQEKYEVDISFVGTIHSDRYRVIKEIKEYADDHGYNYFFYSYLQSKFMYYFYKLTKKEFRYANKEEFQFKKINSTEIANIIDKTKVVLDVQHPNQTGLTMRTIEMVGMQKKIITTNSSIKDYDFYHPENVYVIDRESFSIPEEFFKTPYRKVNEKIYNKYSLEFWILDVLGVNK